MPFDVGSRRLDEVVESVVDKVALRQRNRLEELCFVLEDPARAFDISCYFKTPGGHAVPFRGDCNAPSCICGWAWYIWEGDLHAFLRKNCFPYREKFEVDWIADRIGVDRHGFLQLTHYWEHCDSDYIHADQITGRMAAAALRRLADTGKAYFSLADD